MNRQLRTTLPPVNNKVRTTGTTNTKRKEENAATNKLQHRTLKPLEMGDFVRFRGKNAWD